MEIRDVRSAITEKVKDVHIGGIFKLDNIWFMKISLRPTASAAYVNLETGVVNYGIEEESEVDFPDEVTLIIK